MKILILAIVVVGVMLLTFYKESGDSWIGNIIIIEGNYYIFTERGQFERIGVDYIEYRINQYIEKGVYGNDIRK